MCVVTSSQHRPPRARWYLMARSKGMPNTASHTLLRATGNRRNDMVSVVMCPMARAHTLVVK
jgi:hypothetical protein